MVQHISLIFIQIFLCTIFLHLHLDYNSLSGEGIRAHREENERKKRGFHIYTWVFLTLLRVFVVNHALKNAEPPLKFAFHKCKKLLNTRLLEITAPYLQFQNAHVEITILSNAKPNILVCAFLIDNAAPNPPLTYQLSCSCLPRTLKHVWEHDMAPSMLYKSRNCIAFYYFFLRKKKCRK